MKTAIRADENRSDLAVFNAVDGGPIASVQPGHRVPDRFHRNRVGAADAGRTA